MTSTDCDVDASDSVKLTVAVWPTETLVGCDIAVPKLAARTSMR